jgi:hypothetical protein
MVLQMQVLVIMPITLKDKLGNLIHEITEIKKELICYKIEKAGAARNKIDIWKSLGKKVSSKWDNVSAVEEISQQREKTW